MCIGRERLGWKDEFNPYATSSPISPRIHMYDNEGVTDVEVDGKEVSLQLWEKFTQEGWERLRPLMYPHTNVFVLCFSLACPNSYQSVYTKWYPELYGYNPNAPILLAGLKADLRYDVETIEKLRKKGEAPLTRLDGERLRKDIGAVGYVECSSLEGRGVHELFCEAARVATNSGRFSCTLKKSCCIA